MGCRGPQPTFTFNGALDDFSVYDKVLSEDDLSAAFASTAALDPSSESGLVLYYDFDGITGGGTVENKAPRTSGSYNLRLGMGDSDIVEYEISGVVDR